MVYNIMGPYPEPGVSGEIIAPGGENRYHHLDYKWTPLLYRRWLNNTTILDIELTNKQYLRPSIMIWTLS